MAGYVKESISNAEEKIAAKTILANTVLRIRREIQFSEDSFWNYNFEKS